MKPRSSKSHIGSLLAFVVILCASVLAVLNAQLIIDTVRYYQYTPSSEIAAFASDAGMSDHGKYLFYASQPALEETQEFNSFCEHTEKATAILGCYDGQNIYIFNVVNPRLEGITATTAAHEMLHAAYKRLGDTELARVNSLLEAEYQVLQDTREMADRMEYYKRQTPDELHNELHSIIGTEVEHISAELEKYYARYFSDRSKVVSLHGKYSSVFRDLTDRAEAIRQRTNELEQVIAVQTDRYNAEANNLHLAIDRFNTRTQEGGFTTQSEFAAARQQLIARMAELDSLRDRINNDINEYNTLMSELKEIAIETNELNRSLDSTLAPAPSL